MKAVSRVHITPHMHWDREWYFTTEESRILLVNNMEEILCRLEQDNEYKYYVLDGQTAILEDYFAVKPENKLRKIVGRCDFSRTQAVARSVTTRPDSMRTS